MNGSVVVDCFPESLPRYRDGYAIVAVDVIRATTTALTAVNLGRRCLPVASVAEAGTLRRLLGDALLVGEVGGTMPPDFDMNNSPADLARRTDISTPMILLSSSGTRLLCEAKDSEAVYAACLRNYTAQIAYLIGRHSKVAIIGAGSRGEFREEDQMCCAWIAEGLIRAGYEPLNETEWIVDRWRGAPVDAFVGGKSAAYLVSSGQAKDLEFVLGHVDDIDAVFTLQAGEIVTVPAHATAR
jgi:2-phosphosulfolactate phosphatase